MADKIYTLGLTRGQYSDIMIALSKVAGDYSFLPMTCLHTQINHLIEADVLAEQAAANVSTPVQDAPKKSKPKKKVYN